MTTNGQAVIAKTAHVNMMTDTVVANLPAECLRSIIRTQLASDPPFTKVFLEQAQAYLQNSSTKTTGLSFFTDTSTSTPKVTPSLESTLGRVRAMVGCGMVFDSLPILEEIVTQAGKLHWDQHTEEGEEFMEQVSTVDGDIVQSMTALQKVGATRELSGTEKATVSRLVDKLRACKAAMEGKEIEFLFERGLESLESLS